MKSVPEDLVIINQSAGFLCIDIVNAFAQEGRRCVLLTGRRDGSALKGLHESVRVDAILSYDKSSTWRRLWTWLYGTFQIWVRVFFRYRKSELFVVTNPPFATLVPLFCSNPFWVLVYDIYPDVLVQAGYFGKNSMLARLWYRLHRRVYGRARGVFTIGESMADNLSAVVAQERIHVIENWSDGDFSEVIPKASNQFIQRYGLEDKFIVLYSGNIGNTHSVEVLVQAAEELQDEKDIAIVIVGEGGKKKLVEQMVAEKKLTNCLVLPYQPRDLLSHSLGAASIGVITLDSGAGQLSVPSKTYNLLATGCALLCIAPAASEMERLLNKYEAGRRFDQEDVAGIADYIRTLKEQPELLQRYRDNARNASTNFTAKNAYLYSAKMTAGCK